MNIDALLAEPTSAATEPRDSTPPVRTAASTLGAASGGVDLATFCGLGPGGEFLVSYDGGASTHAVLSAISLHPHDVGCQLIVAPGSGVITQAVILARVRQGDERCTAQLKMDGERIVLHAERDIELRCGEASIVLTRAGKVLIKGEYVLTHSRGANRIKGAYVDIN
nr:hypothetical protein [uncultured Caldimonas sp.]